MEDMLPPDGQTQGLASHLFWRWLPPLMYCLLLLKLLWLIAQLSAWGLLPVALLASLPLLISVGRTLLS